MYRRSFLGYLLSSKSPRSPEWLFKTFWAIEQLLSKDNRAECGSTVQFACGQRNDYHNIYIYTWFIIFYIHIYIYIYLHRWWIQKVWNQIHSNEKFQATCSNPIRSLEQQSDHISALFHIQICGKEQQQQQYTTLCHLCSLCFLGIPVYMNSIE